MRKPPEALKNRRFRGFFRVALERRAAPHRPGSHSSRPKRAGFAAHEHSIADGRQHGKGARRANEALQRAKIGVDPSFLRETAQIGAGVGVSCGVRACAAHPGKVGKTNPEQSDISALPHPFVRLPGFR